MHTAERSASVSEFPSKVEVAELVRGRYPEFPSGGVRPVKWNARKAGQDIVKLTDGREIILASDGQQSPPAPGWVLMLTGGNSQSGFLWTLYGITE